MGTWTSNKNPTNKDKKKTITILVILSSIVTLVIIVLLILIFSKRKQQQLYEVSYDHTSITSTTSLTGRTLSYQEMLDSNTYRLDLSITTNSDSATLGEYDLEDTYLYKASSLTGNRDIEITFTIFDIAKNDYVSSDGIGSLRYEIYVGENKDSKEKINDYYYEPEGFEHKLTYSSFDDIYLYSINLSFKMNSK